MYFRAKYEQLADPALADQMQERSRRHSTAVKSGLWAVKSGLSAFNSQKRTISTQNLTFGGQKQSSMEKMGEQQVLEEAQAELSKRMKALADPAALAMKTTR